MDRCRGFLTVRREINGEEIKKGMISNRNCDGSGIGYVFKGGGRSRCILLENLNMVQFWGKI